MIYNVLLITEQRLKDNSPLNENVDSSELRYSIQTSQNIFLQETLGTNLFETILDYVQTGDINDPSKIKYKELLNNFIQPMLIAYSWYLCIDNLFVKAMNIGLVQNRSEQGQPIDIRTLQYLKNNAKNTAEFQDNLLRRHLVFNSSDYPQYTTTKNNGDLIPEFTGAFKSNIILPGGRRILGYPGYGQGNAGGGYGVNPVYLCDYPWWYGGSKSGE